MKKNEKERVFGLDVIRASAVMLVLLSHFCYPILPLGVIGVEIFFVLSGYLVGGIFLKEYTSIPRYRIKDLVVFWQRRWWRTLPNYYLFILIYAVAFRLSDGFFPSVKEIVFHALFLQNLIWPLNSFFMVSWSLTIEEWFYLLLPFSVLIFSITKTSKKKQFLCGSLILACIGLLVRYHFGDLEEWDSTVRQIGLGRLDALAIGCFLAYIQQNSTEFYNMLKSGACYGLGFFLLFLSVVILFSAYHNGKYDSTHFWISGMLLLDMISISVFLLIPHISTFTCQNKIIEKGIIVISKISYSIYLFHPIAIKLVRFAFNRYQGMFVIFLSKVIAFALAIVVSYYIYKYVERPFMSFRPKAPVS